MLLDFTIVTLQILLVIISFEASYIAAMPPGTPDPLLPIPSSSTLTSSDEPSKSNDSTALDPSYVLDLRFPFVWNRLLHAPPPPPEQESSQDLLPLPNTTSLNSIRMLMRARVLRERTRVLQAEARRRRTRDDHEDGDDANDEQRRVPGGMDIEDG